MKKFTAEKYEGLELSDEFQRLATENPAEIVRLCNGVGSTVGWAAWFYHLIPNTIWGLDITPASDIHDVDYVYPKSFRIYTEAAYHKRKADRRIYNNILALIDMHTRYEWLKDLRVSRTRKYYFVLLSCGNESFLDGKTILFSNELERQLWFGDDR